jgi:hypothetical protein
LAGLSNLEEDQISQEEMEEQEEDKEEAEPDSNRVF